MVVARPRPRTLPAGDTCILAIEPKGILLVERPGGPVSSIAPVLRVGYIAALVVVNDLGQVEDVRTAPISVDPGAAGASLAHLAQRAVTASPRPPVGLIGDDTPSEIVRGALGQLRAAGLAERWIEMLDPTLLRLRLERLAAVLEPGFRVREDVLGAWDLALTFQDDGVGEVIADLERRRRSEADPRVRAAIDAVLDFLARHRHRANYGALRLEGIELPVAARRRDEHLPVRVPRARCRPITVEQ